MRLAAASEGEVESPELAKQLARGAPTGGVGNIAGAEIGSSDVRLLATTAGEAAAKCESCARSSPADRVGGGLECTAGGGGGGIANRCGASAAGAWAAAAKSGAATFAASAAGAPAAGVAGVRNGGGGCTPLAAGLPTAVVGCVAAPFEPSVHPAKERMAAGVPSARHSAIAEKRSESSEAQAVPMSKNCSSGDSVANDIMMRS